VLLASCTSGSSRSVPSDEPSVKPSSSGIERPLPVTEELDICGALPVDVVGSLLSQSVAKAAPGTPGGTLLGECDYAIDVAAASASPQPDAAPLKQVYVSARPNSVYSTFVKTYNANTESLRAGTKQLPAAYSATAGLLVKVPSTDYFLQVAVEQTDGSFLQAPAEAIAAYYLAG
jgi:hypothetical protein